MKHKTQNIPQKIHDYVCMVIQQIEQGKLKPTLAKKRLVQLLPYLPPTEQPKIAYKISQII